MRTERYFATLSAELHALKNRVRDMIDNEPHWLTDGEWKEGVLRQVLRRQLPETVKVGRGFIVTETTNSNQLDILLYDASKPVLFRDGDLVIVTPDAVRGLIEVKTSVTPGEFAEAVEKLATNISIVRRSPGGHHAFAAIFAYDCSTPTCEPLLQAIAAAQESNQLVDFASLGSTWFLRYWNLDPREQKRFHHKWHAYELDDRAAGYFVHNVIEAISPSISFHNAVWYPSEGKEPYLAGSIDAKWRTPETRDG